MAHLGREDTRALAGGVAGVLLGGGLALSLPFASRPLPLLWFAFVVFLAALVPVAVVALWPRRPAPGHASAGPAVRFVAEGTLACANDRYAAELARANGGTSKLARFHERRITTGLLAVPPGVAGFGVAVLVLSAPVVRIVNLGTERVTVELDGQSIASVEPTSVESASAGVEVRITAGTHALVARTPAGSVVEEASVTVEGGHPHLFAPGSDGYCFWLESADYGRGRTGEPRREPLEGVPHFWPLPADLGGWFRPVPEQARAEARLSGGTVTVLRQAPCGADL
jgi:hypothetical protein